MPRNHYSKPLAGGGSRLIGRDRGRFARAALDCYVCPCGAITFPQYEDAGGFVRRVPVTSCHACGTAPMRAQDA